VIFVEEELIVFGFVRGEYEKALRTTGIDSSTKMLLFRHQVNTACNPGHDIKLQLVMGLHVGGLQFRGNCNTFSHCYFHVQFVLECSCLARFSYGSHYHFQRQTELFSHVTQSRYV